MPSRAPRRRARRGLLVALAALAGTLLAPAVAAGPASAHATLLSTDPVDGLVLPAAPERVTFTFDEPVQIPDGGIQFLDATGASLDAEARSVDENVIVTPPPDLADGTYVVSWRVISQDSHPVAGALTFSVGAPSTGLVEPPVVEPGSGLRLVRQATGAIGYLGVLASVGLAAYLLVLLPGGAGSGTDLRRRLRLVARVCVSVGCVAALAGVPVTAAWQDGADLAALLTAGTWDTGLGSDTALAALLILVGLATVAAAVMLAGRQPEPGWILVISAATGAALALGAFALVGHTRTAGPVWLVITVDVLHVSTAAVWFGGLIGLGLTLARSSDATPSDAASAVARFSRVAAVLVLMLGAAGAVLGWRVLNSWSALWNTSYGTVLLAKVAVALAVLPLAGYNRYRLVPAVRRRGSDVPAAWRRLRRTVRAEALLLVAVLVLTGVLVTQDPRADEPAPEPAAATAGPLQLEATLGTGRAVVRLTPGRAGPNSLEFSVLDSEGRPLEPVAIPEVRLSMPARQIGPLQPHPHQTGPGEYHLPANFPLAGDWLIEISVRTSRYENPVAEIAVQIPG